MTDTLNQLKKINKPDIFVVEDDKFKTYGKIIKGINFSDSISYMIRKTDIPKEGNVYIPSVPELEEADIYFTVSKEIYGGMDIQMGYCNGRNSGLNGMEYHKGSEVLVAVTDCLLFLGHVWDIKDNQYNSHLAEVFFIKASQAVELYQTTLHLSPCRVYEEGFKSIVILPKGTNLDLENNHFTKTEEGQILLKRNKWIIAQEDWQPLLCQGAKAGIKGERRLLHYLKKKKEG